MCFRCIIYFELNLFLVLETTRSPRTWPCSHANQIQSRGWLDFLVQQGSKAKCVVLSERRAFGNIQWTHRYSMVHWRWLHLNQSVHRIRWPVCQVSDSFSPSVLSHFVWRNDQIKQFSRLVVFFVQTSNIRCLQLRRFQIGCAQLRFRHRLMSN